MSGSRRFFASGEIGDSVVFSKEEYNHAVRTLRIGVGEEIIVCNDTDTQYRAIVDKIGKDYFSAHTVSSEKCKAEPDCHVALACGFLKGDKTELVIREAVELGIERISVFSSEFSSAYMNENKLARLNKICVEAAKQCGRSRAVKVEYYPDFASVLSAYEDYEDKIFACEFDNGERQKLTVGSGRCVLVVGSEGGFSKKESEMAIKSGYKSVTLGNRILRADTASTVALSVIFYLKGELG